MWGRPVTTHVPVYEARAKRAWGKLHRRRLTTGKPRQQKRTTDQKCQNGRIICFASARRAGSRIHEVPVTIRIQMSLCGCGGGRPLRVKRGLAPLAAGNQPWETSDCFAWSAAPLRNDADTRRNRAETGEASAPSFKPPSGLNDDGRTCTGALSLVATLRAHEPSLSVFAFLFCVPCEVEPPVRATQVATAALQRGCWQGRLCVRVIAEINRRAIGRGSLLRPEAN